nr:MAG TPA: hypothetical protein [Caudoviricetes sp.]
MPPWPPPPKPAACALIAPDTRGRSPCPERHRPTDACGQKKSPLRRGYSGRGEGGEEGALPDGRQGKGLQLMCPQSAAP